MPGGISSRDYEFIRRLVYDKSRINLGSDKVELVRSRVQKRLRALKLDSFSAYCELLRSPGGEAELTCLLDVISTNVTEFFRESRHFEFLRKVVLPGWKSERPGQASGTFSAWSAACSSGEEVYSLAILLAEFFGEQPQDAWQVVGSDISRRMLEEAERGIYPGERMKLPTPELLRKYFQKGVRRWEGRFRVKPLLRDQVQFRYWNLFDWPYPFGERFQVVFCRNVMIYFDRPTQEQLVTKLTEQVAPGGYLFVGHSESLIGIHHGLKSVSPSIYQKA